RCKGRLLMFFFSSRRRHTRLVSDWSSDVCSSDLEEREGSDVVLVAVRQEDPVDPLAAQHREVGRDPVDAGKALVRERHPDVEERSEERRVGKEGGCRWSPEHEKKERDAGWERKED